MSAYKKAGHFVYWKFPTSVERLAMVPSPAEIDKVALQENDDSLWRLKDTAPTWLQINAAGTPVDSADIYIPLASFNGEIIPTGHQRLVYGDFEIIGDLVLEGDLVLL